MIPYAIMGLELLFSDGERLPVRVLDLSDHRLTFRLSKRYPETITRSICHINTFFYEADRAAYHMIPLQEFEVKALGEEKFWREYALSCCDQTFAQAVRKLSGEYLSYISLKMEASDGELSEALCGYPADQDEIFAKEFQEQRKIWLSKATKACDGVKAFKELPLAIRLSEPAQYETYLKLSFAQYLQGLYEKTGLAGHPITAFPAKYLYIGNLTSVYLLPDQAMLKALLQKAGEEALTPVLCLPPLEERDFKAVRELLADISGIELVVSDWGIMEELSGERPGDFLLNFGPLLNKQRKDPRLSYKKGLDLSLLRAHAACSVSFRSFLRERFGITRYGFSCSGYVCDLPESSADLWLPFYLMNRGCPEYIRTEGRRYPEHLHMVGRASSVYGYDEKIMMQPDTFAAMTRAGIDRIVLEVL